MRSNPLIPTEYIEAVLVAEYLDLLKMQGKILCYSHIPNETFTKHWSVKVRNRRMGVNPGVPDYVIVTPSRVLFLELKRVKGSRTSREQLQWLTDLDAKTTTTGIAHGFDEAKTIIDREVAK